MRFGKLQVTVCFSYCYEEDERNKYVFYNKYYLNLLLNSILVETHEHF